MCIPSTNLPDIDHTSHHSQQWVTPELGLKSTRVNEILTMLMYHRQQERLCHSCPLKLIAYSPSFPTCLSHPRKCAPSLLNNPSAAPLLFQGFNNRPNRKSQSPVAAISSPNLTRYTNRYGYGYRFRYSDIKVQRIARCMCELSWNG